MVKSLIVDRVLAIIIFNTKLSGWFLQKHPLKSDFQHAIESHCSERDAITVLRSCLGPEPGKLIEGITTNLKAAWEYLIHNYEDARVISDAITADLEKFKPLQSGDDHRFWELVNLVRKSFNVLNEVKQPQDMDNTHIISLNERKMTFDDLKVWSRHIYVQMKEPLLMNLLKWMDEEMTVRLRLERAAVLIECVPQVEQFL